MRNPLESEFIILTNVFVYFLSSAEQLRLIKFMIKFKEQVALVETH